MRSKRASAVCEGVGVGAYFGLSPKAFAVASSPASVERVPASAPAVGKADPLNAIPNRGYDRSCGRSARPRKTSAWRTPAQPLISSSLCARNRHFTKCTSEARRRRIRKVYDDGRRDAVPAYPSSTVSRDTGRPTRCGPTGEFASGAWLRATKARRQPCQPFPYTKSSRLGGCIVK